MAVIYGPSQQPPEWSHFSGAYSQAMRSDVEAEEAECFYCGKAVGFPALFWMGATGNVYLHPDCLQLLIVRLMRDLHEIQCMRRPKS